MEIRDWRVLKASVYKTLKVMGVIDGFKARLIDNMSINILKQCPLSTCILRRGCMVAWRGRSSQSQVSLTITSKHFLAGYKVTHPSLYPWPQRNYSWRYRLQIQSVKVWTPSLQLTSCLSLGKFLNLSVILFPHPECGIISSQLLELLGELCEWLEKYKPFDNTRHMEGIC